MQIPVTMIQYGRLVSWASDVYHRDHMSQTTQMPCIGQVLLFTTYTVEPPSSSPNSRLLYLATSQVCQLQTLLLKNKDLQNVRKCETAGLSIRGCACYKPPGIKSYTRLFVGDTKGPQNARLAASIDDSVTRHAVTIFYKKPSRLSCLM